MTEKEGLEYADSKYKMNHVTKMFEKDWERKKEKDVYAEAAKIQKLTITDLEKLLTLILEKDLYVRFRFGEPDMGKDLLLPFTVHDAKPDRTDMMSAHDLNKLIGRALEDTNWHLMGDGASYRLGILTGRLRAYEREEDLVGLVRRRKGSMSKASKV
jgi:hypothetical protein